MKTLCSALTVAPDVTLYHAGPALDHGPLPSLFYFALSGPDSLTLDPFNQPVAALQGRMIRIFSLTLPAHENGLPATEAMSVWAEELAKGTDRLNPFLDSIQSAIDFAIRERFVDPAKMAAAGLSRGALIAAHAAARDERFRFLLAFAPLTRLSALKEFASLKNNDLAHSFDLAHLAPRLFNRHTRLYIGNHDTRVGTRDCFDFAMALVEQKKTHHPPQVEMIITPSLGRDGHGTAPEIFQQGSAWLTSSLIKTSE